jgi:hydroxymethylpyrimidine/phosphomethylpyrimidine kinase
MSDAPPVVLTVAGSDPSGGAGVQADLKTIHQHGGYGVAVPTLITVQSTDGVEEVELLSPDLVRAQLSSLLDDLAPAAAKTGAIGSPAVAHVLGSVMEETRFAWVVDPVWLPTRGMPLSKGDMVSAYRDAVIPRAALVTPNVQEAALLAGVPVRSLEGAREAAKRIAALGAQAVLVIPRNRVRALGRDRDSTCIWTADSRCRRRGQSMAHRRARACFLRRAGREARESFLAPGR